MFEALWSLTRDMHWVGAQNGEAGTGLGTSDYIDFVYRNMLSREPDAGSKTIGWTTSKVLPMVAPSSSCTFSTRPCSRATPTAIMSARVWQYSKYSLQEEYSGPTAIASGQTQQVGDVLSTVFDELSAVRAIQGMIDVRQGSTALSNLLVSTDDSKVLEVMWSDAASVKADEPMGAGEGFIATEPPMAPDVDVWV